MIDLFNRTHSDVQIEEVDCVGSDYDIDVAVQGRQRLLTEIVSGKAPDIMELGYGVSVTGGIPVNRVDYEYTMNFLQQEDRYLSLYAPGYLNVECPIPTAEQIQRFNDFFNSIDKFILSDLTVYDIVMDAAAPYFAGDLGIDETIQRIESRVGLYINENK